MPGVAGSSDARTSSAPDFHVQVQKSPGRMKVVLVSLQIVADVPDSALWKTKQIFLSCCEQHCHKNFLGTRNWIYVRSENLENLTKMTKTSFKSMGQ